MRIVISVWAATLLIAFFLGWIIRGFVAPKEVIKVETVAQGGGASGSNIEQPVDIISDSSSILGRNPPVDPSEEEDLLNEFNDPTFVPEFTTTSIDSEALLSGTDPVARMGAFVDALRKLSPETLGPVLQAFEKLPNDRSRSNELQLLFHAWSKFAPKDAIEYAQTLNRSEAIFATRSAVASWASYDATAAMEWAENHEDENVRAEYLVGIVQGVASFDMGSATELLYTIDKTNYRYQAAALLVQDNLKNGVDSTIEWAESLPDTDSTIKKTIFSQVASAIARQDPQRGAEWALSLSEGDARNSVISTVINYWSRESHQDTADWVAKLPEGGSRYKAIEQMVNQWAWRDPASTAEWLNQFPSTTDLDPALENFSRRIATKAPEVAADWANSILDTDRKEQALERVYSGWKKKDPDQAEIWARNNAPQLLPENKPPSE